MSQPLNEGNFMNIIIFGSGGVGIKAKRKLEEEGNSIDGVKVLEPLKAVKNISYDMIAIGVYKGCESIKKQLLEYGVRETDIIIPIKPPATLYENPLYIEGDNLEYIPKEDYESNSTQEYLKLGIKVTDEVFLDKLDELKRTLLKYKIPREKVCVVSGGVLQAYGLRESKKFDDIDIIMTSDLREIYGKGLVIVSDTAEMHVQNNEVIPDDEIILNVDNHFIFRDLKFMKKDV
jgi:hypothetical protein